jgi:hypothetical protein
MMRPMTRPIRIWVVGEMRGLAAAEDDTPGLYYGAAWIARDRFGAWDGRRFLLS